MAEDLWELMFRTPTDENRIAGEATVKHYLDTASRDPHHMNALVGKLHDAGVLSFRQRARCFVSEFTFLKNDGFSIGPDVTSQDCVKVIPTGWAMLVLLRLGARGRAGGRRDVEVGH